MAAIPSRAPARTYRSRLRRTIGAALALLGTTSGLGLAVAPAQAAVGDPVFDYPPGAGMRGFHIYDISGGSPSLSLMERPSISDNGVISGTRVDQTGSGQEIRAFVWSPGRGAQMLDTGGSAHTWATAISPDGDTIVGFNDEPNGTESETSSRHEGYRVRWRWNAQQGYFGPMERLAPYESAPTHPGDEALGVPLVVNNAGDQLLSWNHIASAGGGVLPYAPWDPHASIVRSAADMNASGGLAGVTEYRPVPNGDPGRLVATVWSGGPAELGLPAGVNVSYGMAINDNGDAAVEAWMPDGAHTLLYEGAGRVDLGRFYPADLNDRDQVVGSAPSATPGGNADAMLWNGAELVNLNDLVFDDAGWDLRRAVSINERGQIVGLGYHHGKQVIFLLDPITPVVFVPGAAASRLVVGDDPYAPAGTEIWLGCLKPKTALSLDPADDAPRDVDAVDAMRFMQCGPLSGRTVRDLDAYGTFLEALTTQGGFVEYDVADQPARRTGPGCDLSQKSRYPSLFVFAYDWRKDNTIAADELADYIDCVRQFHPTGPINIVTHSMGSLVARRYAIVHPAEEIGRMITIGAPWLGAPKLVHTLQTGDFAPPLASGPEIARMAQRFTATHQLMSAELYHRATGMPVVLEDGWDLNGSGGDHEAYTYEQMAAFLDGQSPVSDPAANATFFQHYSNQVGGQVDWRNDQRGIEYFHVVGLQAAERTIGQVVATGSLSCIPGTTWFCTKDEHFEINRTFGDGTVPLISATRQNGGFDYNAPTATLLTVTPTDPTGDHLAEHTGLTANPEVYRTVIELLHGGEVPPAAPAPAGLAATRAATATAGHAPSGTPIDTGVLVGGAAARAAAEQSANTPLRVVTLLQADDVQVSDQSNHSTRPADLPDPALRLSVPGMSEASLGQHGRMLMLPAQAVDNYTARFVGTGRPARIEASLGTASTTSAVERWIDVDLAAGTVAELTVGSSGVNTLRVDTDNDGTPDTVVAPDVVLSGEEAADTDAPQVSLIRTAIGGETRYAVVATDAGSGVARTMWSTDGRQFVPVDGPVALPAGVTTLYAFAEDNAGNRSSLATLDPSGAAATPYTTATVTPAVSESGWTQGDATIELRAAPADGGSVHHLTYSATGATTMPATVVNGDRATVLVADRGRATITFAATAADGTTEPTRSITVGIDDAAPTVELQRPVDGGVVDAFAPIRGLAADDAAGVASVRVRLTDADGRAWNGSAWTTADHWLSATGTETWSVDTGLPAGSDAPAGSYRMTVEVTDRAGRVTVRGPVPVTVSPTAGYRVLELAPPPGEIAATSAVAIDGRGAVTGAGARPGEALGRPVRWRNGLATELPSPAGVTGATPTDASVGGTVVGRAELGGRVVAVAWGADGTPSLLPPLSAADLSSAARAVNAAGVVVGLSGERPVRWDGGVVSELAPIASGATGEATGVSDTGLIVGRTSSTAFGERATIWRNGVPASLGTLGGNWSHANDVNDVGQVVGMSVDRNGVLTGFVSDGVTMVPVTGLFATSSEALAVSGSGTVVGTYTHRDGSQRAFVSTASGDAVDLADFAGNPEGWTFVRAYDIDDAGQIVGFGTYHGLERGFVLGTVHAPMASDATATTAPAAAVTIELPMWDPDPFDTAAAVVVTPPAHGTVTVAGARATYTPVRGFVGTDTFTFRATDGTLTSTTATAVVTVEGTLPPVNQPPVADDSSVSTDEDVPVTVDLVAHDADGDALTYTLVTGPSHGTFTGVAPTMSYSPEPNWHGTDTVTFLVADGTDVSRIATITFTVRPVNDLPTVSIVTPATGTRVLVGQAVVLDTTAADPVEGGAVSCTVGWGDTTSGGACDDTHAYTAAGTYTITVTATDPNGGVATATTTVVVAAPAPPPPPPAPGCTFKGFFEPVANAPKVNSVKAGSTVPVKFTYCSDGRLTIFPTAPSSSVHACSATVKDDKAPRHNPPSTGTLTFDRRSKQYTYTWKTDKAWVGQCRTLVLRFVDGTEVTAEFRFR